MKTNIEKMLMSVVTYGEIYERGKFKNNYDIIQQFIMYVIVTNNMFNVMSADIKSELSKRFGFVSLPIAVIEKILLNMQNLGMLSVKKEQSKSYYVVNKDIINNMLNCREFDDYEREVESNLETIKNAMFIYFENRYNRELTEDDKNGIINKYNNFIYNFLDADDVNNEISKFILHSDNSIRELIQKNINAYIVFEGLNYDINNFDLKIDQDICLYLDMEILFDICGYNGTYHETRAMEMLKLVSDINKIRNNTIKLYYLPKIKNSIEDFFDVASKIKFENVVEYKNNVAMNYIHEKCDTKFDIKLMKNDFFSKLQTQYKIFEDTSDYYSDIYKGFNQAKEFYSNSYFANVTSFKNKDEDIDYGICVFDVILKQRKNEHTNNFFDSKAVLVSETKVFREMSKFLTSEGGLFENEYRLSMGINDVTNILWLKLGKGLGNVSNIKSNDVTMLAKMIISKENRKKLNNICKVAKQKLDNREITKEAYINTIAEARANKELMQPENIDESNADISFDIILSTEASLRFEKNEKNKVYDELKNTKEEIKLLKIELENYRINEKIRIEKEELLNKIKKHRKKILKNVFIIILIVFLVLITLFLFFKHKNVFAFLTGFASLVSLILFIKDTYF